MQFATLATFVSHLLLFAPMSARASCEAAVKLNIFPCTEDAKVVQPFDITCQVTFDPHRTSVTCIDWTISWSRKFGTDAPIQGEGTARRNSEFPIFTTEDQYYICLIKYNNTDVERRREVHFPLQVKYPPPSPPVCISFVNVTVEKCMETVHARCHLIDNAGDTKSDGQLNKDGAAGQKQRIKDEYPRRSWDTDFSMEEYKTIKDIMCKSVKTFRDYSEEFKIHNPTKTTGPCDDDEDTEAAVSGAIVSETDSVNTVLDDNPDSNLWKIIAFAFISIVASFVTAFMGFWSFLRNPQWTLLQEFK